MASSSTVGGAHPFLLVDFDRESNDEYGGEERDDEWASPETADPASFDTLTGLKAQPGAPKPEQTELVTITINGISGHLCDIDATPTWVIADVKRAIQAKRGIPHVQQRLLSGADELEDSTPLAEGAASQQRVVQEADFLNGTVFTMIRMSVINGELWHQWTEGGVPRELTGDCETVMAILQGGGFYGENVLAQADATLRAQREVVLAAVRGSGGALKHASPELKADREVVLAAVSCCGEALEFAPSELKADRELVVAAVGRSGLALKFASEVLRAEREVVQVALRQHGCALEFASEGLRADVELVRTAVEHTGRALQHASVALRAQEETVRAAVEQDHSALEFASPELQQRCDLVACSVRRRPTSFWDLAEKWQKNEEVMLAIVQGDGWMLQHLSASLRDNKRIVLEAVKNNGWALGFASKRLGTDREVVAAAVQRDGHVLQFASAELRADRFIAQLAVCNASTAFHHVALVLQIDPDFRLFADHCRAAALAAAA